MISEQLKVKTTVQPGTGLPNFIAVANGEVDIAMSYTLWGGIYVKGYYTELGLTPANPSKVAFLVGSSEADYHALIIAHKDLPAKTFAELIELVKQGVAKPAVPASAKSVDEFIYRALFKKYGLEWDQFKIPTPGGDPAVESFIEGKYNVLLDASPLASPQWQQIDTRVPDMVKVIYFSDDDINYVINYFGGGSFIKSAVPKGLYSYIKEDYPSFATSQIIIVRADLPEDLVYYIAKLLDENRPVIASSVAAFETYNPAKAILTGGLQIHPGAERYYREKGYIK
ncbi:MAG: TAXI family TRAP transporter solute-binding subunit [Zestosphaera sp.]